MTIRRITSVLLISGLFATPATARAQLDSATAKRVDQVFARFDGRPVPGCAVAVKRNGAIVYERGYGLASLELGVPITPTTVMDVGSVSKQFTAASILLLAIDGKLSLDDDVRKFLPELPALGARVTLRHLITHTSGWRDYTDLMALNGWDTRDHTTDRDAFEALRRVRAFNFPPGTSYRYSNTGFFLLGQVVSRVSGMSLAAFARSRIFEPLGMTRTRFLDDTRQVVPGRATAYDPADSGFVVDMSDWDQVGDGAVQTTVEDLARWESNFDSHAVGGARMAEMQLANGRLTDGRTIAYTAGLFRDRYRGIDRVQHGGAWAGYRASLMRFPSEHLAILLTCNRADAGTAALSQRVADIFLPVTASAPMRAASSTPRPSATQVSALAGSYVSDAVGTRVAFDARGDTLVRGGAAGRPLVFMGGARWEDTSAHVAWVFLPTKRVVLSSEFDVPDTLTMVGRTSSLTPAQLAQYVGRYAGPEVAIEYEIALKNGALVARTFRGDDIALRPVFTDAFGSDELPTIRFVRDASGRVTAMSFTTRGITDVRLTRK